jgi:hypothetical protein
MSNDTNSMERPNGFLSFLWGLLMIGGVVAFVSYRLNRVEAGTSVDAERAAKRVSVREQSEKADQDKLHSLAWIDKSKGTVHLPIGRAQELVAAELASKKKVPSTVPVDAPLPPAAPFDPNAAEPAPPALPSAPQGADLIRFPAASTPAAQQPPAEAKPTETPAAPEAKPQSTVQ